MLNERIAKVAHEANRAYCETLGDYTQKVWECTPVWQYDSCINGVRAIKNGTITKPEQSHENWMEEKEDNGWVYGEVKDPDKKLHPCMVPFNELPKEQQVKDHLFFAIVKALI